MTKDELKKLAEQWASEYKPGDNMVEQVYKLLDRVQKEVLQARIEWPNIIEYEPSGKPHEIAQGVADWLLDNLKTKPTYRIPSDWDHQLETPEQTKERDELVVKFPKQNL